MAHTHQHTADVTLGEDILFSELHLSPALLKGLTESGFVRPTPIQLQAIPLGRFGVDLVAQAKAGTGKTCVFTVVALESLKPQQCPQVLILSPTREIALQTCHVVTEIGKYVPNVQCHCFIGGTSVQEDLSKVSTCTIATGTPGRLQQLIEEGHLPVDNIHMLVLDEADQLFGSSLLEQMQAICKALPSSKQVLAFSATYPAEVINTISNYTRSPQKITLDADQLSLLGVSLFKKTLADDKEETLSAALLSILDGVSFNQCIVFSNNLELNINLCKTLTLAGWPVGTISGSMSQQERSDSLNKLRTHQTRILIATDLLARGVDIEHVDLVINLHLPSTPETFLHRVGRSGRYGTLGLAISFLSSASEPQQQNHLQHLCDTLSVKMEELPTDEDALAKLQTREAGERAEKLNRTDEILTIGSSGDEIPKAASEPATAAVPRNVTISTTAPAAATETTTTPVPTIAKTTTTTTTKTLPTHSRHTTSTFNTQRAADTEQRGRGKGASVQSNNKLLVSLKEKGWPEPRSLSRLMETEEWSHPKSIDMRKRVRSWRFDVFAATKSIPTHVITNLSDLDKEQQGYVSKEPPDVISPLTEIMPKTMQSYVPAPDYHLHSFNPLSFASLDRGKAASNSPALMRSPLSWSSAHSYAPDSDPNLAVLPDNNNENNNNENNNNNDNREDKDENNDGGDGGGAITSTSSTANPGDPTVTSK